MNEKVREVLKKTFDIKVKELKDSKFNDMRLRWVKEIGSRLKIDSDEISLYQNGYINEDILCVCIIQQRITRYKNNDWHEYLNNITKFIKEEFNISLDDFLLKNLILSVFQENKYQ